MSRVSVKPDMLKWAINRSRKRPEEFAAGKRFQKLENWLVGEVCPTMKQLKEFAQYTHTPFGYFFLETPPEERLPLPDFRTLKDEPLRNPSADLLETLYTMQRRQTWLRESMIENGAEPLPFVGSVSVEANPMELANAMRKSLGLTDGWAKALSTWEDALGALRRAMEKIGVLTVINGIVGNSTNRKLNTEEFRGFCLSDPYAPLVFVNGADAKSARMFTLAHELAHVWIGQSALSGFESLSPDFNKIELFCNHVAAEFLLPGRIVEEEWKKISGAMNPIENLAKRHKVSPIVAARRLLDLKLISKDNFFSFYNNYKNIEFIKSSQSGGGDFYRNQSNRVGERFATEVILAAKEGRLLYQDAYKLTGLYGSTFDKYANQLGFDLL